MSFLLGILYTLSWIEFWRRSRNDKNKHSGIVNKPLDCDQKPSLPKEVLAKADIDVLSHSDLLQSINSHLNTNSTNPNVSASTTLSKPANVGDLKLEIVDTRYYLLICLTITVFN